MKILVGIKRVIDYNVRVQINRDGTDLTWVGQHGQLDAVQTLAIHPLP